MSLQHLVQSSTADSLGPQLTLWAQPLNMEREGTEKAEKNTDPHKFLLMAIAANYCVFSRSFLPPAFLYIGGTTRALIYAEPWISTTGSPLPWTSWYILSPLTGA